MAEQLVKLFSKDIQSNLFPDNAFYKQSKLDGGIDVNAQTVQIPQSGAAPTVQVNPSSFPLTAAQRVDNVKEYDVDLFATTPIHIRDVNEAVINYSKRADVLRDHISTLNTTIGDNMANAWGNTVTDNILKTTGAARPASVSGGADKRAITYNDIVSVDELMDIQDIPMEGRNLLVSARMYSDLLKIDEFISIDYANSKAAVNGAVGTILGFNVFKRSRTLFYDDTFGKKPFQSAGAATDRDAAIFWHPSFVRRAEGNVDVYSDIKNPLYLGSIFNAAVRNGGMIGRTDEKGVVTLVQETA